MAAESPFATIGTFLLRLHAATSKETAVLNFVVILRSTSSLETKNIFNWAAVGGFFYCFVFFVVQWQLKHKDVALNSVLLN